MKRDRIGYGVALLAGLLAAGIGTSALAQSADKLGTETVTATTMVEDTVTMTVPDTSTEVVAPGITTESTRSIADSGMTTNDDAVGDVSGACDGAEHASDPGCTGVGTASDDNDDRQVGNNDDGQVGTSSGDGNADDVSSGGDNSGGGHGGGDDSQDN